jgi:hypothetical protein
MTKTQRNILFVAFGATLIVAGARILSLKSDVQKLQNQDKEQIAAEQAKSADLQSQLLVFEQMVSTDNLYFQRDYQEALAQFSALSNEMNLNEQQTEFLELRTRHLKNLSVSDDPSSALLQIQKAQIDALNADKVSLAQQIDSLKRQSNSQDVELLEKIKTLEKAIVEKDKRLAQKDKLQVLSFKNDKGNLIHYLGEIKNGKAEGNGIGIWETGGIYKGNWRNNQRHGEGTYTWKDGHVYEGTFVNDIREGEGTYTWTSGEKYVGEWRNNQRHGAGILYDKDNNIKLQGNWKNDKLD